MDKETNKTESAQMKSLCYRRIMPITPVMHSTDTKFSQNETTEIGVIYVLYFANIIQKLYEVK